MLHAPFVILLFSLHVTSQAFYVRNHLDEPTVRKLMLTNNARRSSSEIAALGGIVTQQLSKNYIIVLLLPSTRWKDTNATRLATNQNYLNATEYAQALKTFDLVNRPYNEDDDADIDLLETVDDDCPDGDCYVNEEDYTLPFEENEDDDTSAQEKTWPTIRPLPPKKESVAPAVALPQQRNPVTKSASTVPVSSTSPSPFSPSSSTPSSSSSNWIVEWRVKNAVDGPTAKAMVSSGTQFCLPTSTATLCILITLMRIVSL